MDATSKQAVETALLSLQGGQPKKLPAGLDPKEAKKAAQDFEAVFLSQMLSHMFAGIKSDKVFGGGPSEDMYRSMMVQEYGKVLAQAGGVGIADSVMREMIRIQEVQQP
jgi:flagellar protein FlgJ